MDKQMRTSKFLDFLNKVWIKIHKSLMTADINGEVWRHIMTDVSLKVFYGNFIQVLQLLLGNYCKFILILFRSRSMLIVKLLHMQGKFWNIIKWKSLPRYLRSLNYTPWDSESHFMNAVTLHSNVQIFYETVEAVVKWNAVWLFIAKSLDWKTGS